MLANQPLNILSSPSAISFAIADANSKIRETGGDNRSPKIDLINQFVGNPLGSPYCAAGVSYCFHQAGATNFPFSGLAKNIRDAFHAKDLVSKDPQAMLHWHGALFGWTNENGHGHIGFVQKRLTNADGDVTAIITVEYNTDLIGSPNGDGVYYRTRATDSVLKFWYLDTSEFKGGAWWEIAV